MKCPFRWMRRMRTPHCWTGHWLFFGRKKRDASSTSQFWRRTCRRFWRRRITCQFCQLFQCGRAVVCTQFLGFRNFIHDGIVVLQQPPPLFHVVCFQNLLTGFLNGQFRGIQLPTVHHGILPKSFSHTPNLACPSLDVFVQSDQILQVPAAAWSLCCLRNTMPS